MTCVVLAFPTTNPLVGLQDASHHPPANPSSWVQFGVGVGSRGVTVHSTVAKPDSVEQTFLSGMLAVGGRLGAHVDIGIASFIWFGATDQTSGPSGAVGGLLKWAPGMGINFLGGLMYVVHSRRFLGVNLEFSNPATSIGAEFVVIRGEHTTTTLYFVALHTWSGVVRGVPADVAGAQAALIQFGIAVTTR